ncbi:MAG: DnaJ domain-containing protein [Pseudomonadota bacterium]
MRIVLLGAGAAAVAAVLIFGIRFVPAVLPELLGLAGVVIAALVARAVRRRSSGGFSSPGHGRRTAVRTAIIEAWIDHETGEVGGTVLAGRFGGRTLDGLTETQLLELHEECAGDADSARVLESYLDRRLGADWRNRRQRTRSPGDMTREEALAVLGLGEGANVEEIKAAHRRLIQRMHPDVGGSAELAARINRAKDVLLDG